MENETKYLPIHIERGLFCENIHPKHLPEMDGSIMSFWGGSGYNDTYNLWSLYNKNKPLLKFKSCGDWGLSIDIFPKSIPMFVNHSCLERELNRVTKWRTIKLRQYNNHQLVDYNEYLNIIKLYNKSIESNIPYELSNELPKLSQYSILVSEFGVEKVTDEELKYLCVYTWLPDGEPLRTTTSIKNIIEALKYIDVNVTFNGRILKSTHAPLLSSWFLEPYEMVYIEKRNDNETDLICEGKNYWSRISYGTS